MKIFNLSGKFLFEFDSRFVWERNQKFKIEDADFEEKDIQNLEIENVLFEGGNFDNANARGIKILRSNFEGVWLCDVDLSSACLGQVEFYDVEAYRAKFRNDRRFCFRCKARWWRGSGVA